MINNSTTNSLIKHQQQQVAPLFKPPWNILYVALTTIIITIGVTLNSMTAFLYWKRRIIHNNFNYALQYISIIGIFQLIGFIPFMVLREPFHPASTYDARVSVLCSLTQGMTLFFGPAFANVYIISFLSMERYLVIKHPLISLKVNTKTTSHIILVFCTFAFLISLPNFPTFKTDQLGLCTRPYFKFSMVYATLVTFLGLVIPTVIMVIAYVLTIHHLFKASSTSIQENSNRMRHRKKIVRSLGVLIGVFLICWTPFSINWIASYMGVYSSDEQGLINYKRINNMVIIPPLLVPTLNNIIYGMTKYDIRGMRNTITHKKNAI